MLKSLEIITTRLVNESLNIDTCYSLLNITTFTNTFNSDFDSSVKIDILEAVGGKQSITIVIFASMNSVLPARDQSNISTNVINGKIALIQPEADIKKHINNI